MNQKASGNINKLFTPYPNDVNNKMLKQAFAESKNGVAINDKLPQPVVTCK
jgi:hypothetical protein